MVFNKEEWIPIVYLSSHASDKADVIGAESGTVEMQGRMLCRMVKKILNREKYEYVKSQGKKIVDTRNPQSEKKSFVFFFCFCFYSTSIYTLDTRVTRPF